MLNNMTSQDANNENVKLDERDRDVSEPRSIEGRSTVDIKTGELVWEPEQVRDMRSGITSMEVQLEQGGPFRAFVLPNLFHRPNK